MKIAFLTPEYPHPKTGFAGGIGTSIRNLAAGLVAKGISVSILIYGQPEDAVFSDNGITFYRIRNVKFKGISRYLTQKKIEKLINTLVGQNKVDLVEAPDWTGITSFIKPKCPMVIRLNGSDTYFCYLERRPVKWRNRFHEKRALKRADALISVSRFTADTTNTLFKLRRNFTIIPNGVDISGFEASSTADTDSATILYFGTLIRKKGLLELPLIFNEVHKQNTGAKLVLIGKDSGDILTGNTSTWTLMRPLFSAQAIENVSWKGSVPYDEIKTHIENATVCVFPTFAEALPVSWIEAMAMQKPIVASNVGWAAEVIDDEKNGFLVYPANHAEFAKKIVRLIEDEPLRQEFGTEARKKAALKFSVETVAEQSANFYRDLIQTTK